MSKLEIRPNDIELNSKYEIQSTSGRFKKDKISPKEMKAKTKLVRSKMVRNPCAKEDHGCSCICFFSCFGALQAVFFSTFLQLAYDTDYQVVLRETAEANGFVYDQVLDAYKPELPPDSPYHQKDNFMTCKDSIWVPALLFYLFGILWLISYFKLICTDIRSSNIPKDGDLDSVPKTPELFCR